MAQLKSTSVVGNLAVTGNVVASQIIKLDGTNKHLLAADGGVYNLDNFNSGILFSGNGVTVGQHIYSIYANQYIRATWLQHNSGNLESANYNKICITDDNGWIYYRTKKEFIKDLDLSQVYNYKGTLENLEALKLITSARVGDVYFISDINTSWACKQKFANNATGDDYEAYWSNLGLSVDLSGYVTKDTKQTIIGQKTFTETIIAEEAVSASSGKYFIQNGKYQVLDTDNVSGEAGYIPRFIEPNKIRESSIFESEDRITLDKITQINNILYTNASTPLFIGMNGKVGIRAVKTNSAEQVGQINISDSWYGNDATRWGAQMSAYDSMSNVYNQVRVSHNGLEYLIYNNNTNTETSCYKFQYNTDDKCIDVIFN